MRKILSIKLNKTLLFSACAGVALMFSPISVMAQTAPAQACQEEAFAQMDFWLGEWVLTWTNPDGSKATGSNTITKTGFGDCVVTENFNGAPGNTLLGMSVSTYSKRLKLWRQTWVDNQGGYIPLTGGLQADGRFVLETERFNDEGPFSRMAFEDIKAESLTWRWQGKAMKDAKWADQWVIEYKRKAD